MRVPGAVELHRAAIERAEDMDHICRAVVEEFEGIMVMEDCDSWEEAIDRMIRVYEARGAYGYLLAISTLGGIISDEEWAASE